MTLINQQKLIILGAGPLARVMTDIAEDLLNFEVLGFVIDQPPFVPGSRLLGKPIFWIDEVFDLNQSFFTVCSIYQKKKSLIIDKFINQGINFINLIHPSSVISRRVLMGDGNFIAGGVQISSDSELRNHSIINRGSLIGHDVFIEDFSVLSPGVNLASGVKIGSGTYVGMGANIIQNVTIGEGCYIGAGSLVTRDVPDHVKVVGMPARVIEREIGDNFL